VGDESDFLSPAFLLNKLNVRRGYVGADLLDYYPIDGRRINIVDGHPGKDL
jgi:hypothetical protein